MDAAAGHCRIQMLWIAWVDADGMELGPIWSAVLNRTHPLKILWVFINIGESVPGHAAVIGSEQTLRRRAGIPGIGFVRMTGGEPKHVVHRAARLSLCHLSERRRRGRFLPVL